MKQEKRSKLYSDLRKQAYPATIDSRKKKSLTTEQIAQIIGINDGK